jgi:dTDP-4-dehydrorhamnose 3,5-epimerase
MSIVFSKKKGTLRGLHYQTAPAEEVKIARCTRGAIYDVVVDLRPESPTFKDYVGVVLSADNRTLLYVPERCAQGYQTLEDNTEVVYQMSEFYAPECARGVRWNDPAFGIVWPLAEPIMLERDRKYPDFSW